MSTGDDTHAHGLSGDGVDALRYSYAGTHRGEVTDRLLSVIPPESRLLDVGCGTGSISQLLRERLRLDFVGLEPNAERSAVARSRGLDVRTDVLDSRSLDGLGLFDVVLFADVLEHLVDPVEVLRVARMALKPGGVVVASVPNVAHWFVRFNLMRGKFEYQSSGLMDATHLRWFTRRSVRRPFEAAGFVVAAQTTTSGALQPFYTQSAPWRWVPGRVRDRLVLAASQSMPGLFGLQHIVTATPTGERV